MGNSLISLSIPRPGVDDLKSLVRHWMAGKGFEQCHADPIFECDPEHERGFFLISNDQWAILLYSHMTGEGERLLHELHKLSRPVLRTWLFDSDVWGYELYRNGELAASFNSNPSYFADEEDEPPLQENGNPDLLCQACDLAGKEPSIERCQQARALFMESVCERFCAAIDAPFAALDYRHLEETTPARGQALQLGRFQMEHLWFVRPGSSGPPAVADLHAMRIRQPEATPEMELQRELAEERLRRLQARMRLLFYLLLPVWLIAMAVAKVIAWLKRLPLALPLGRARHELHEELRKLAAPAFRQDGQDLINDRHRCRLTLPDGADPLPALDRRAVFGFRVKGMGVMCQALRPEALEQTLTVAPGTEIVSDDKLFAGALPARLIVLQTRWSGGTIVQCVAYVQAPRAIYRFWGASAKELPPGSIDLIRAVVTSFELTPE